MQSNPIMETRLQDLCSKGIIIPRTEKNPHLKVSYRGAGSLVTTAWNIKIYTSGTVVCTDGGLLKKMLDGGLTPPDLSKTCLQVDDAGVGFPLLGIMVGVTDGSVVKVGTVDVSFFRDPAYQDKSYLREYARKGWDLVVGTFKATPQTHRIEICTGAVNAQLKLLLQERGYEVRGVKIEGLLQDQLEALFREYVLTVLGEDIYYDPKGMDPRQIAWRYKEAIRWAYKNRPEILKNGWKSLGGKT